MKVTPFYAGLLMILAIVAGALGAFATNRWIDAHPVPAGMHHFVHDKLRLNSEQEEGLARLEQRFAVERRRLELALKSANAELAAAMDEEHYYGPRVGAAIDEVHANMGDQQKATVRHVFEMRGLLDKDQQKAFDRQVRQALTSDSHD